MKIREVEDRFRKKVYKTIYSFHYATKLINDRYEIKSNKKSKVENQFQKNIFNHLYIYRFDFVFNLYLSLDKKLNQLIKLI